MEASDFIKAWEDGVTEFTISSSGSTGPPKPFVLQRQWMEWSALQSGKIIQYQADDILLCCLPLNKVGGLMVLVRAQMWKLKVEVITASSNPLLHDTKANIVSLTPYQLSHIFSNTDSYNRLKQFKEVLIGGSAVSSELLNKIEQFEGSTIFRHSYGMSETYSHIAIRTLNGPKTDKGFVTFPEVQVIQSDDETAIVIAPFCLEGLKTSDRITFLDDGSFKVIGRNDFIINTGGVKINAEEIEKLIDATLKPRSRFAISSLNDEELGEKIVLVTEDANAFEGQDWNFIKSVSPYAAPKTIIQLDTLPMNQGDKMDRIKIRTMLIELTSN
ncbi:MAG: AMP-binding protein [Bacteroidia bacterium]|nr:AMP-binding protein [Bacteroidia bacterium]